MKVAVVGSRNIGDGYYKLLCEELPLGCSEIISGGSRGIDRLASMYATEHDLPLVEYLPKYEIYGKRATLIRNEEIVKYSDYVVALWDGKSNGTRFVIDYCLKNFKPIKVVMLTERNYSYD